MPGALMLANPDRFATAQRMAQAFASSDLVPKHMQGNMANCLIAITLADEMGENPLMVMQNIVVISGRAGWMTQYMISRANTSGVFCGPLRWRTEGAGDTLAVTCFGDLAGVDDDPRVEVKVSLAMAKADGWTRNEKYKSIPEQMLRWRSAAWLIRLYAPQVMFGMPTDDELQDTMKDVTPPKFGLDDFKPSGAHKRADPVDVTPTREEVMPHKQSERAVSSDQRRQRSEDNASAPAVAGADPADLAMSEAGAAAIGASLAAGELEWEDALIARDAEGVPPAEEDALRTAALERMDLHVPFEDGRPALWVPLAVTKLRRMQKDHAPAADYEMFKAINFAAIAAVRERHPQHHRDIEALIAKGKAS